MAFPANAKRFLALSGSPRENRSTAQHPKTPIFLCPASLIWRYLRTKMNNSSNEFPLSRDSDASRHSTPSSESACATDSRSAKSSSPRINSENRERSFGAGEAASVSSTWRETVTAGLSLPPPPAIGDTVETVETVEAAIWAMRQDTNSCWWNGEENSRHTARNNVPASSWQLSAGLRASTSPILLRVPRESLLQQAFKRGEQRQPLSRDCLGEDRALPGEPRKTAGQEPLGLVGLEVFPPQHEQNPDVQRDQLLHRGFLEKPEKRPREVGPLLEAAAKFFEHGGTHVRVVCEGGKMGGKTCPMGGMARAADRAENRIDFLRVLRPRGYRTRAQQKPNLR